MIGMKMTAMQGLVLTLLLTLVGCSGAKEESTGEEKTSTPVQAGEEPTPSEKNVAPADSKADKPVEPVTVTLWFAYRAEEQKALEATVKAFNSKGGAVQIDAIPVPYDAFVDKLELTIPNGHGPDLFIFAHNMIGHWSKQEMIEPLSGKASGDTLGRFLPETVKALVHNKTLYGLPMAFKNLALYYNKSLVPTAPTTFAEVRAIQKATRKLQPSGMNLACSISMLHSSSDLAGLFLTKRVRPNWITPEQFRRWNLPSRCWMMESQRKASRP